MKVEYSGWIRASYIAVIYTWFELNDSSLWWNLITWFKENGLNFCLGLQSGSDILANHRLCLFWNMDPAAVHCSRSHGIVSLHPREGSKPCPLYLPPYTFPNHLANYVYNNFRSQDVSWCICSCFTIVIVCLGTTKLMALHSLYVVDLVAKAINLLMHVHRIELLCISIQYVKKFDEATLQFSLHFPFICPFICALPIPRWLPARKE